MALTFHGTPQQLFWQGSPRDIVFDTTGIQEKMAQTDRPCYVMQDFRGRIGVSNTGALVSEGRGLQVLAMAPPMPASQLGDPGFREEYRLKYAYKTGAMANGIASTDLVIAIGKDNLLGSFGAAGLVPERIQEAIDEIQAHLPHQTFAVNLIHSPAEEALEAGAVKLFLEKGVRVVEASAYLALTEHIVHYRVAGLSRGENGGVLIGNRVIAKISRKEVAAPFMQAPPPAMVEALLQQGKITPLQAELAQQVPMADDITVEADSGGHTDNRPLVTLLPIIIQLRDEMQAKHGFAQKIRVGAAGGIATPASALAAFMMGAAYVVTGSVNQACVEAGTSEHVRKLLQQVDSTDVIGAPASDMFEMGVELQVLKRGTLFGPRAKKLYEYYMQYKSIDDIPAEERLKLEKQVFRKPLEEIWKECISFFESRDPHQIARAKDNPHRKMALIFRWYLGLSSNWANAGTPGRELDYQIWCGPSMGAFNDWVKGSYLEHYENRKVADVAEQIMCGAALLYRMQILKTQGIKFPTEMDRMKIIPAEPLSGTLANQELLNMV
ncbi:MAG: PfaD family polyunsaturated fatty acid/polyketide biosynthesis protein [Lewinellaceae bacterium]|nr:PfaD family polyunsaturated fatty acid/polyketide biosynthesis protein [Saprospiraceae bacterium]MCB9339989.1 PfaD family polyunsaturated fatty acid/polyketide biosynthesis protein [Lewinellaceae bacterium]